MPDEELFNLVDPADEDEQAASETRPDATLGERLRARRREQGLSLHQAAQELRADPAILRAIEADDFSALGAPVYIKGHLRKYAGLLGLPPDEVFADYARTHEMAESMPVISRAIDPGPTLRYGQWLGPLFILLLVLAIGAVFAWWLTRDEPAATPAAGDAEPVSLTGFPPMPAPMDAEEALDAPIEAPPPVDPAAAPAAAEPGLRIDLVFVGESWVEVTDADGQRLVFGLMRAGTTESVVAAPPVQVLFGDATAVRLDVNGEPYDIAPVQGGVARFTIPAP